MMFLFCSYSSFLHQQNGYIFFLQRWLFSFSFLVEQFPLMQVNFLLSLSIVSVNIIQIIIYIFINFISEYMSYPKMRSLFLDDIYGTRPTRKNHDKSIYRLKHQEQIRSVRKNPEQWHQYSTRKPTPFFDPNIDTEWRLNKKLNKSVVLNPSAVSQSKSQSVSQNLKIKKQQPLSTSILSGSGKNLLNDKNSKDPYFPHRYVSDSAYEKYCWTGNREWVEKPKEMINLAPTKQVYYPRWN